MPLIHFAGLANGLDYRYDPCAKHQISSTVVARPNLSRKSSDRTENFIKPFVRKVGVIIFKILDIPTPLILKILPLVAYHTSMNNDNVINTEVTSVTSLGFTTNSSQQTLCCNGNVELKLMRKSRSDR